MEQEIPDSTSPCEGSSSIRAKVDNSSTADGAKESIPDQALAQMKLCEDEGGNSSAVKSDETKIRKKIRRNTVRDPGMRKLSEEGNSSAVKSGETENRIMILRETVPDPAMARMLKFLRVDLRSLGRKRKGYAVIDQNWVEQFVAVDWTRAFDEDDHLRLDQVIGMLPTTSFTKTPSSLFYYLRRFKSAVIGLHDFNQRNKVAQYYLVRPIVAWPIRGNRALGDHGEYVSHTNFLAKRKNVPDAPAELFFASVGMRSGHVSICEIIEPHLYPPDISRPLEKAKFGTRVIHHERVDCRNCDQGGNFM